MTARVYITRLQRRVYRHAPG